MPDALLFRSRDGAPPEWKVCADDWIEFYQSRGWFLLARESEILYSGPPAPDRTWTKPPRLWRPRPRPRGTTGE